MSEYKPEVEVVKVPVSYALAHRAPSHETLLIAR